MRATGRPDCRRLSVFRQATMSWTVPCQGTAKEWNAHSERPSWESGVDARADKVGGCVVLTFTR